MSGEQNIKIQELNLGGLESAYINILVDNDADDDNLYAFPFSKNVVTDFNNRVVSLENYKDIIDIYNFLMICEEGSRALAMEIAKLDKKNNDTVFREFYNRFAGHTFMSNQELKVALCSYCKNSDECEEKYGFVELWDVSSITDMSRIFYSSEFNGDISGWDVSSVTDMSYMFMHSSFNGDISYWDVSCVKNMYCMFYSSKFNGDISEWDVSSVTPGCRLQLHTYALRQTLVHAASTPK